MIALFAAVGPAPGFAIAVAIFAARSVVSRLSRFRYGPLEWRRRGATCGRLPALRVPRTTRAA